MMTKLIKYQPFTEVAGLRQAMDRLFEDRFFSPYRSLTLDTEGMAPRIDAYQTDKEVVVKASLPGVKPEDVDISIDGGYLTIKGETKGEEKVEEEDYIYREHRHGVFSRTLALPDGLVPDKAQASFEDGILNLTIPKAKQAQPKKIKIKAAAKTKAATEEK